MDWQCECLCHSRHQLNRRAPEARLGWSKRIVGALPFPVEDRKTNMFFLERPNSPEG